MFNRQFPSFQFYQYRGALKAPRCSAGTVLLLIAVAAVWGSSKMGPLTGTATVHAVKAPPTIDSFSVPLATAGQSLKIIGTGFSPTKLENTVFFKASASCVAPPKALVNDATATELDITVPPCAATGTVRVEVKDPSNAVESTDSLPLKTSISGVVQGRGGQALPDVRVTVFGQATESTNADGVFFIADVKTGKRIFGLNGLFVGPPHGPHGVRPLESIKVDPDCDNLYPGPIELAPLSPDWLTIARHDRARDFAVNLTDEFVGGPPTTAEGEIKLLIPSGARVGFPGGAASGRINLALFEPGRAPGPLPAGHFSAAIAQLFPFGTTITPGAQLILPNRDQLPAKQRLQLFRYEQDRKSPRLGRFVEAGTASVSDDGQQIVTEATAIKVLSYYFASLKRPTGTLKGQILDGDQRPAPNALVVARGQYALADAQGNYVAHNVPVLAANDRVTVEASWLRPDGRVDRAAPLSVTPFTANGETVVPQIVLPAHRNNLPPKLTAPTQLSVRVGQPYTLDFQASDPEGGTAPQVQLTGATFATLQLLGQTGGVGKYLLSLSPTKTGFFTLWLSARDELGVRVVQKLSVQVAD